MSAPTYHPLPNGQIRFSNSHTLEMVQGYAKEWKNSEEGKNLKSIAVRSCGDDRFGIVFVYDTDGTKKSHDKFIYKLTDKLLRSFGREVSWDITSGYWTID